MAPPLPTHLDLSAVASCDSWNSWLLFFGVESMGKLWGGRFVGSIDPDMEAFNASIPFDERLWDADLRGSEAWVRALTRARVLSSLEAERLLDGLARVREEWGKGSFHILPEDEDIHTANERRLTEIVGPVAGKLHTGRSRNDQVATDTRIYLRDEIDVLDVMLADMQGAALELAKAYLNVVMPGYTHLQRAQPIRFSHWMMSYFWMWQRDRERLAEVRHRVNVCPLGSGALAGTPFPIDRAALAEDLGFDSASPNSMDAVSDRDYIVEFLAWGALLGVHLSRLAEDLILWSSSEFRFVSLADAYSTGSSLMPQKKNPDSLELLRGKAGRLTGNLMTLLVVLKGLPSTYDKDLQEDKEPLFDAVDTLKLALPVAAGVLSTLTIHPDRMRDALSDDLLATDLADYLVRKGVPFRESHRLVGLVVRRSEELGVPLSKLHMRDLTSISSVFDDDVDGVWDFEASVERRNVLGGTSAEAVKRQIEAAEKLMLTFGRERRK